MWAAIRHAVTTAWTFLVASDHWAATFLRAALGATFGVSIIFFAESGPPAIWRRVVSELGLAIILASIAVFMIEVRAHDRLIKRIVAELTTKINDEYGKLVTMGQAHFDNLAMIVKRTARDALPGVLSEVFKNFDPTFKENTIAMIKAFEKMEATKSWTDRVAMRFVGELFQFVSDNAINLQQANEHGGTYDIILPQSSRHLADIILAGQMDVLQAGDSYVVISDLSSWRDGLGLFFDAQVGALQRGVKVRRLICPWDYDGNLTQQNIDDVIERHWDDALFEKCRDAKGVPLYELGVMTRLAVRENQHLNISHVGVFHHQTETACFEPKHSDLSRMEFSRKDKLNMSSLEKLWLKAHKNYYKAESGEVCLVKRHNVVKSLGKEWWR